jgi:hypothetical protein
MKPDTFRFVVALAFIVFLMLVAFYLFRPTSPMAF